MYRHALRLQRLENRFTGAHRIAHLLSAAAGNSVAGFTGRPRIFGNLQTAALQGSSAPICSEWTRLNDQHLDSERRDFFGERFGKSFDCKFGGVVIRHARKSHQSSDG